MTLLDIPLCRGEQAAERGKLLIMGGGDKAAFDACRPAFAAFADAVFHLGPLGSGEVGKMVNNLILWACISANDEGLKLGNKLGVDRDVLREALVASSASNWALASRIEEQPMPWAEKDMTIVLKEADLLRMSVPLCGVVKEVVKTVKFEHNWPTPHEPGEYFPSPTRGEGKRNYRGRTTVSTSAGLPAFTCAMARRSAPAMSAGFSIGPSAYQPMLFAMVAKSGSGPLMSWAI